MPSKLNKREQMVREEAKRQGWRILDKGWPDFLLYDWETRTAVFLEVKSCNDGLRPAQKRMHKTLKKLGLDVRVVHISKNILKGLPVIKRTIKRS